MVPQGGGKAADVRGVAGGATRGQGRWPESEHGRMPEGIGRSQSEGPGGDGVGNGTQTERDGAIGC